MFVCAQLFTMDSSCLKLCLEKVLLQQGLTIDLLLRFTNLVRHVSLHYLRPELRRQNPCAGLCLLRKRMELLKVMARFGKVGKRFRIGNTTSKTSRPPCEIDAPSIEEVLSGVWTSTPHWRLWLKNLSGSFYKCVFYRTPGKQLQFSVHNQISKTLLQDLFSHWSNYFVIIFLALMFRHSTYSDES